MSDRLTAQDIERVKKTRAKYLLAEKNKTGDRLTKRDIEAAEESLSKMDELPEGLKKDTTTGYGANIIMDETPERKSKGGAVEIMKGGDYIKDLIK